MSRKWLWIIRDFFTLVYIIDNNPLLSASSQQCSQTRHHPHLRHLHQISDLPIFFTRNINLACRQHCIRHLPRTVCQCGSVCRAAAAFEVFCIHRKNSRKQGRWRHWAAKLPTSRDARRCTAPEPHTTCCHWQSSATDYWVNHCHIITVIIINVFV